MAKIKESNPLNFFMSRQLELLPAHFEVHTMPMVYNLQDSLTKWIMYNLKGRFYIGKGVELKDNKVDTVLKVGFEDPKEASYFALACPHLKYH